MRFLPRRFPLAQYMLAGCLTVGLSGSPSIRLSACLRVCAPVLLSVFPAVCLFVCPFSACSSTACNCSHAFDYLSVYSHICRLTYKSTNMRVSVCVFACVFAPRVSNTACVHTSWYAFVIMNFALTLAFFQIVNYQNEMFLLPCNIGRTLDCDYALWFHV